MSNDARRPRRLLAGMLAGALALSVTPILGFTGVASAADPLPPVADPIGDGNFCEDTPGSNPFTDVQSGDPSFDEILCLVAAGITEGTTPTTYQPNAPITRRQMALFLKRVADLAEELEIGDSIQALPAAAAGPAFDDIADEEQFIQDAISQISQAGIAEGFPDDTYRPASEVSRRQMAAFINRLYTFLTGDTLPATGDYFDDDNGDSGEDDLNATAEAGIFQGDGAGNVNPAGALSRRQMANVLLRTAENLFEANEIDRAFEEDDEAPSNQSFTVAGAQAAHELGAANARTCAVTVPAGTVVDLQLIPTEDAVVSGNTVSLADADQNELYTTPGTAASIIAVNGAPVAAADNTDNVTSGGTVNVTIRGDGNDDVSLLVFADPATGDNQLALTNATPNNALPKIPTEMFGVGCRTFFVGPEGPLGQSNGVNSNIVNRDLDFLTDTGGASTTFYWDGNDVFQFQGVALTQAQFEGILSSGGNTPADTLNITYATDPTGVSTFNVVDDDVVEAAGVTATAVNADGGATINDVRVVFTPSNLNGPATVFDIVADTNNGGAGAIELLDTVLGNNVTCTPAPATGQCTLTFNNAPNGTYDILVRAENPPTAQMSTVAASADITVPGTPDTTAPLAIDSLVTTNGPGLANTFDAGDVVKVVFNEAMGAPAAGDTIRATDNDATTATVADFVNGTNATFTLNALAETVNGVSRAAGTVLTVTLTSAPSVVQAGTAAGLQIPATVTDQSGNSDANGVAWNPATAGQDVVLDQDAVDNQNNSLDTAAPTATSNNVAIGDSVQVITFNEAINPATLTCADITTNSTETCTGIVMSAGNTVATVTYSDVFEAADVLTLAANSVTDVAGNAGPTAALNETAD